MKIDPPTINYNKPLKQVLIEDFKSLGSKMPIKGGWGYTQEEAIIIDKNDPDNNAILFDGVCLEYHIAKLRALEELIIFRQKDDKHEDVQLKLSTQSTVKKGELVYDKLIFNVTAIHKKTSTHVEFEATYWFEISSFY